MRMFIKSLAAILAVAASAPAFAQTAFDDAPVDEQLLGEIAGRADTATVAQSEQTSVVAGNSVGDGSTTGDVQIDGSAFSNLQGLSLLNVNTGNNVSMNTSMNVTISINPGL
jgi:hypothetical protein